MHSHPVPDGLTGGVLQVSFFFLLGPPLVAIRHLGAGLEEYCGCGKGGEY